MSLTIQQIVLDAKNLALKLKDSNLVADNLISQGQTIHRQMDIMKQYADDINDLNDSAGHRPHNALIASIQQENRHLRDLQQENRELRAALEEQQSALELIMSKYRQQISKLVIDSHMNLPSMYNQRYSEIIVDQAFKIQEMAAVMGKVAEVDEIESARIEEQFRSLSTENQGLRNLLEISKKNGSLGLVLDINESTA
ncbi:FGFR1 oncogene partner 2 homolog [Rhodnius prolixus]|uniref:Uncharacterized protein n=2 Tax=Rhodnius TaxID=13248 RepID=T1HJQ3_RHOPR